MKSVVAVLVSDVHLSEKAPVARSAEPDWFAAMARPLVELRAVADEHSAPIICGGDIFDRWNPRPPLVNFALDHLPEMYAIPGQHDLANHNYQDIEQTAYWTLCKAGVLSNLNPKFPVHGGRSGKIILHAFPWGHPITPRMNDEAGPRYLNVAVCHQYVWTKKSGGYPGADPDARIDQMGEQLAGYDAVLFGDNHKGFQTSVGGCSVMNPGTFMRRKQDERAYRPMIGLLLEDGTIEPHYLDTDDDKFTDREDVIEIPELDAAEFIDSLRGLDADSLDFREVVRTRLNSEEASDAVRKLVMESVG